MKLLYVFAAILAISVAETEKREIEDSEAAESMELLKEGADLKAEASAYNSYVPPSQRPPLWTSPTYVPPANWNPPQEPVNSWNPPQKPVNSWNPPKEPVNSWTPPQKPVGTWVPPVENDYVPHYPVQSTWYPPHHHLPTTTTPSSVIKNEQYYFDNGAYKYEYQIADGTHVGEEGYFTDPKRTDESLVKRGWYSFVGGDGKTYTVKYWADHTGYHAYGDHLPTPPPVPAAIQAALDKEEAEKNKPQYTTQAPQQIYYPTQAPYVPPKQPAYIPPQQPTYYPQQTYYPPQPTYPTYG